MHFPVSSVLSQPLVPSPSLSLPLPFPPVPPHLMSFSAPSSLARSLSHPLAVILTLPRPSFYPFFCSPSLMTNETAGAVSFVRVRASRTAQLSTTPFPNWLSNMRAAGRTRAGCRRGVGCVCGGGGAFKARRDCGERVTHWRGFNPCFASLHDAAQPSL